MDADKNYYYYLRKEPCEIVDDKLGVWKTYDRALYKHKSLSRYYRDSYPFPKNNLKLYKTKSLQSAVDMRMRLFEYSNEVFDIYRVDNDSNQIIRYDLVDFPLPKLYATEYLKLKCNVWADEDGKSFSLQGDKPDYKRKFKKGTILKCVNMNRYYGTFDADKIELSALVTKSTNRLFGNYDVAWLLENCNEVFEITYDF